MVRVVLLLGITVGSAQAEKEVTEAEKKAFLELLARLPTRGEFLTDEAVEKAVLHTRVLLALTEKDIGKRDLYPFLALSRGLLDRKDQRAYGVKHFDKIAHATIKLAWAVMLFDEKAASPEIVVYLRAAIESKEQSKILAEMVGAGSFEDFKKRVKEYPLPKK